MSTLRVDIVKIDTSVILAANRAKSFSADHAGASTPYLKK
jgi:hypothetical protein